MEFAVDWNVLVYPLIIVAFGITFFLRDIPDVLSKRSDNKVRIQELKAEEARELRLKAEIEHNALAKRL